MNNKEYDELIDEPINLHIWKKYVLEFINELKRDEFSTKEVIRYIKNKYGSEYEDLSHEEFANRTNSTLNQLAKEGSFKKSKDFYYELEKKGLHDIKLEKYKNYWSVKLTTLEQHKEKQELLQRLKPIKK